MLLRLRHIKGHVAALVRALKTQVVRTARRSWSSAYVSTLEVLEIKVILSLLHDARIQTTYLSFMSETLKCQPLYFSTKSNLELFRNQFTYRFVDV